MRKLKRHKKVKQKASNEDASQKLFVIANDLKSQGQLNKAVTYYRKAIKHNPHHGEAYNNLGNTLHLLGKLPEALTSYRKSCEIMPGNPQVHFNLGTTLYEAGHIDEAIIHLKQAIALYPDYAEAYSSLGVAYQAQGDLISAVTALQKAISLNPDYPEALRFLGLVLKDQGDIKGAIRKFTEILQKWPEDAFTRYLLTRYKKYSSAEDEDVTASLTQLAQPDIRVEDSIFLHFALGKIYDDLGQYKDAFHHYTLANQQKRSTFGHARISTGIELQRIKKTFTPALFARFASWGSDSELPVFIVGMPRSGTTLVEQICASHSAVHGAGELKLMRQLVSSLSSKGGRAVNYPECLGTMEPSSLPSLAGSYLAKLKENIPEGILRVTDKMPTNFIELGLIRLLFPRARIIHCIRDPLDTCLSNYFQYFSEGNECSFDLEELALYFRKYQALMQFWKETLPGGIFEIRYEELVADLPHEAKRLIQYLGLEWQEHCLSYFKTKRMVHTSSDWQVRQPIYAKSVQRWKNYEPYLQSLRQALENKGKLL